MTKPVLAIDIDEVIADSMTTLRLLVNEQLGVTLTEEDYSHPGEYWTYHAQVWDRHGIKDLIDFDTLDSLMLSSQIEHIKPKLDAVSVLSELTNKFDIVLVTARDPRYYIETERWLNKHLGKLHKDLHVIGNHRTTKNPRSKGSVCREIGAVWLIDDNQEHCLSALEHGTNAILFGDYGWHHSVPAHIQRAKNWKEVSSII